ncbi:helix-turn-helix domain-containing protein [Chelativorans sp. ZYF759]|uniref:helix-turn-helix domain-containing protein n=1 Tax=Chelativorans sp. ZYF759 TaxID=2692213 RepID=UPI00145DE3D4|nr:helix-turn-helix transcriptional regulator [Chelativorans sp. ZYF759]NMG40373.1 helix-turn-helix domain-containing protein [Chelativorans sp. ZYF759]
MDHHARHKFYANLKYACSTRVSISDFCREVGLNRQQFNRYINGQARPSPHNLLRIASAFGLEPGDFTAPPEEFRRRLATGHAPADPRHPLLDAFPGDLSALRRYLGFYQTYHLSLSWPGHVVCSCAHLREEEGHVVVTTLERIEDAESGIRQRSRYVGLAAFYRNRIFITERTRGDAPTFGQTVLMPFEVHQRLFLRGVTMGVSWRKDNQPYASRMIWRHHGHQTDRRALISRCGSYTTSSGNLPSPVVSFLGSGEPVTVTLD